MKKITQLLTALVICSLMVFASCGGGKNEPKVDARIEKGNTIATITGATATSVTLDGDARSEWDGTTWSFDFNSETFGGNFTVADIPSNDGASDVWPASGTWSFNDDGSQITAGGKTMNVAISGSTITLTFDVSNSGNRAASFDGEWVFSF